MERHEKRRFRRLAAAALLCVLGFAIESRALAFGAIFIAEFGDRIELQSGSHPVRSWTIVGIVPNVRQRDFQLPDPDPIAAPDARRRWRSIGRADEARVRHNLAPACACSARPL